MEAEVLLTPWLPAAHPRAGWARVSSAFHTPDCRAQSDTQDSSPRSLCPSPPRDSASTYRNKVDAPPPPSRLAVYTTHQADVYPLLSGSLLLYAPASPLLPGLAWAPDKGAAGTPYPDTALVPCGHSGPGKTSGAGAPTNPHFFLEGDRQRSQSL